MRNRDPINGKLTEDDISFIIYQVFEALEYMHTSVICTHRDINAEHFRVDDYETLSIKLTGFGNSTYDIRDLSGDAGELNYLAPEIIKGLKYDYKVDIWSAGVLAYFFLTN